MSSVISPELSEETLIGYDLLRAESGRYELKQSGLIELRGEDRKGWLQGQVTNELRSATPGTSIHFCMCTPTGQMIAACEMWALSDRFFVRVPKPCMAAVLDRCENMIVLEDVQYADRTPDFRLVSIQGPEATRSLREFFELPSLDAGTVDFNGTEVITLRSNRTGYGGWDLLLPRDAENLAQEIEAKFEAIDERAYNIARLEFGLPRFGVDMNEKTLPPEMGPSFVTRNISYSKGCYTGQEVLMRMHSRGHTNKTWMALESESPLHAGAVVSHRSRPDAGIVTSAEESPQFGFIAGAMLRNEAAFDGEVVTVETDHGKVEATVRPMPLLRFE